MCNTVKKLCMVLFLCCFCEVIFCAFDFLTCTRQEWVCFFFGRKNVFGVENLGIFEKDAEGVENWENTKGLAEKRLVGKMLFHYLVGRNVWFYFREMTKVGAFSILHTYYRRNSSTGNEKA